MLRWVQLLLIRWWRRSRLLWRCPTCGHVRRWGCEHPFDDCPMLVGMWELPACCRQAFPLWAYSSDRRRCTS